MCNRLQEFLQLFFQVMISDKIHNPVEFLLQGFQQRFGLGEFFLSPPHYISKYIIHKKQFVYIQVSVTNYVSRKCLFYGVCEFFFCSISALATYLPLILEICHLHCHLCFCKRLFFISKRKCISNRFTVSRLRFLKDMTIDITRCSYAGMSHIT